MRRFTGTDIKYQLEITWIDVKFSLLCMPISTINVHHLNAGIIQATREIVVNITTESSFREVKSIFKFKLI